MDREWLKTLGSCLGMLVLGPLMGWAVIMVGWVVYNLLFA
jgi:hypothetical protein